MIASDADPFGVPVDDARRWAGWMRELFVQGRPILFDSEQSMPIERLLEPESPLENSARSLCLRAAIDKKVVSCSARLPGHDLLWKGQWCVNADGETCLAFPAFGWVISGSTTIPTGDAVLALLCRSGALTGPYLNFSRDQLARFATDFDADWGGAIFHWVDRHDNEATAHLSLAHVADSLWLLGDVASHGENRRNIRVFLAEATRDAARVARGHSVAICWSPGQSLWSGFDAYLAGEGAGYLRTSALVLYTRYEGDGPSSGAIRVCQLSSGEAQARRSKLLGAVAAVAGNWLLPDGKLAASLGQRYRLTRSWFELLDGDQPIALVMTSGLPATWNARRTCNCSWIFTYVGWDHAQRSRAITAVRGLPGAEDAPGVLEPIFGPPLQLAASAKLLEWRVVYSEALGFFENAV